ncbi:unnamed protein product [Polarella glacialis]|uniref:Uncharacterized protein n=1 Tax=Polarella glacialis TaxID=89957 RepID=A0A813EBK6_POLGL|nr:unnamed protein product [Polarella glacialis]
MEAKGEDLATRVAAVATPARDCPRSPVRKDSGCLGSLYASMVTPRRVGGSPLGHAATPGSCANAFECPAPLSPTRGARELGRALRQASGRAEEGQIVLFQRSAADAANLFALVALPPREEQVPLVDAPEVIRARQRAQRGLLKAAAAAAAAAEAQSRPAEAEAPEQKAVEDSEASSRRRVVGKQFSAAFPVPEAGLIPLPLADASEPNEVSLTPSPSRIAPPATVQSSCKRRRTDGEEMSSPGRASPAKAPARQSRNAAATAASPSGA